jgi:hypothetical protein
VDVLHDDVRREYAYGPAHGLPDSKVGTFSQLLYDVAQKDGWTVISSKASRCVRLPPGIRGPGSIGVSRRRRPRTRLDGQEQG